MSPRRDDTDNPILVAGKRDGASYHNVHFQPPRDDSLSLEEMSIEDVQAQLKKANEVMKSVYLKTPYKVLTFK